jgi:hypothetical protein
VAFVEHSHRERNHQGLGNELIDGALPIEGVDGKDPKGDIFPKKEVCEPETFSEPSQPESRKSPRKTPQGRVGRGLR